MKYPMKRITRAIRAGLVMGVLAAAGVAQAAAPQQSPSTGQSSPPTKTQPKTLATVVVTGSLIRRVDIATASVLSQL